MKIIKKTIMIYLISIIFSSANAHPIIFHQKIEHINYYDLHFLLLACIVFIFVLLSSSKIKNDEKKY
tara:strand:- start:1864 stop:2064 length:201 start_codon:yes stop_codon:yes gene_type:complete